MALTCLLTDLTNHFTLSVGAFGAAPRDPINPTISRHVRSDNPFGIGASTLEQYRAAGVEAILDVHSDLTLNELRHSTRAAAEVAEAETRHDHPSSWHRALQLSTSQREDARAARRRGGRHRPIPTTSTRQALNRLPTSDRSKQSA
jgi:hypothetical protein